MWLERNERGCVWIVEDMIVYDVIVHESTHEAREVGVLNMIQS